MKYFHLFPLCNAILTFYLFHTLLFATGLETKHIFKEMFFTLYVSRFTTSQVKLNGDDNLNSGHL